MDFRVDKVGDWARVRRELNAIRDDTPDALANDMDKISWAVKDYVINMIKGQTQKWADLKPDTVQRKKGGAHNMALYNTGLYLESIGVYVDEKGTKKKRRGAHAKRKYVSWYVTASGDPIKNNAKYTYLDLAHFMEYGVNDKMIPARPHWRVVDLYAKNIVRKLKRKYDRSDWPVPKMGVW